ncbi:MAG TPA: DNA recombination protein RmuC, partial [Phycisphaerae bacterium]|nr:DNA recombination protein RmuC [Phycisphaerae bacterium]
MDIYTLSISSAILGAALGATIAWLYTDRKSKAAANELQTARALAEQRAATLAAEIDQSRQQLTQQSEKHATESAALRGAVSDSQAKLAAMTAQLAASERNIAEQQKLLEKANETLTASFATVSRDALARSNEAFLQMAQEKFKTLSTEAAGSLDERKAQIGTLLKPIEEMLAAYQKRLAEIEASRTSAYGELLKQIGSMSATQETLTTQTTQLASALKKSNVRGRWGEIELQRLAEMAGMTEHVDFSMQESTRNEEGRLLRPDMLVRLPGDRCVVVDSKAVINAFLDAVGVTDDTARQELMRTHARNVRSRIDDLASKAYWSQFATAPEFVVLFLPGESFLYGACECDHDLIQYAISQRVLLATPTTFIGLLQTIERGWRQEALSQNAETIRKLGTEIYDRLATLSDNMTKLGKSLDSAMDNYNKTVATLDTRLIVSARKIGEMGARSDKELESPPTLDKRARELSAALHPDKSPLLPE